MTLGVGYWPANVTATIGGSEFARWQTGMWGVNFAYRAPESRWSLTGHLFIGGQHSGEGTWSSLGSSSDTIWSLGAQYRITSRQQPVQVRVGAGWGGFNWSSEFAQNNAEFFWSKGLWVGGSTRVPLGERLAFTGYMNTSPRIRRAWRARPSGSSGRARPRCRPVPA